MAEDEDYEGEMDADEFGDEEQMDDLDLEPAEDDAERIQVIEVSSCFPTYFSEISSWSIISSIFSCKDMRWFRFRI